MKDARGLEVTCSNASAIDAYEKAVRAFHTYTGDPLAPLDEALAIDPGFAAAAVTKAILLMSFFERRFARDALGVLDAAGPALARATPREKSLAAATRLLAEGEWERAGAAFDRILMDHPRDAVALQIAHLVDFLRGDSLNLRNRISRVLPHWSGSVPGYAYVLGMHAFGLEECNQYPEAEAAGRRSLELARDDCWAVHAVTHVMEMQGRIDEGVSWLTGREADWASPDNGFAFHNWWHLALFHLDRADYGAALAVYDKVLAEATELALTRVDGTALLWRLMLEGADVGSRFEAQADGWENALEGEGGFYAFNDFHAAMAFAATGRQSALARLRRFVETSATDTRSNGDMTRFVGRPAIEAVEAFCRGRDAEAVEKLVAIRDRAHRFGGSHAQRDVLTLTIIEAARRAGMHPVVSHYAAERLVHKPRSAWGHRLAARTKAASGEPALA